MNICVVVYGSGSRVGTCLGLEDGRVRRLAEDAGLGAAVAGQGWPGRALQHVKILVPVLIELEIRTMDGPLEAVV